MHCGDPDAFYRWPLEVQERVLAWWRVRHTPAPAKATPKRPKMRDGDSVSPEARAFWGI